MAASAHGYLNTFPLHSADPKPVSMAANSAAADGSANGNPATIAANDFLTLLVTEMKNQDPTASTDPNEYVNQLVQVNSLQQLISINETLQKATASSPDANAAVPDVSRSHAVVASTARGSEIQSAAMRVATALSGR